VGGSYADHPPLNGVERIAADMMAISLPQSGPAHHPVPLSGPHPGHQTGPHPGHQTGPHTGHQSGPLPGNRLGQRAQPGGWQAMPPILPPAGTSPNIPTAIVPPGVPPHGRTLGGGAVQHAPHAAHPGFHPGGGGNNERIEVVHPRMMAEQAARLDTRGADMGGASWSSGGPPENCGYAAGGAAGRGRDYQSDGATYSSGGRTGGSGRIIPSSSGRAPSFLDVVNDNH
jgi:hypothetical protein